MLGLFKLQGERGGKSLRTAQYLTKQAGLGSKGGRGEGTPEQVAGCWEELK